MEREARQVILAGCTLRLLESAGPHAADQRLVAGNMQTAAAFFLQENATTRPLPRSIHDCPGFIRLWPPEISRRGFTGGDQEISLVREYIDTVLATGISARE